MTDTTDQAYSVTADELSGFIQRIEAQNERIAEETEARKEIYAEAVARGYDSKALREIIRLRKMKADERAEREAVLELYMSAIGMQ